MRKWVKPLLMAIVVAVVGGSCFYLGNMSGYREGYLEGMADQAIYYSVNEAYMSMQVLKTLERKEVPKEILFETQLESSVLVIASLDKYDNVVAKALMKDVANYIKEHPFKEKPDPQTQKFIDKFIGKYGAK